LNGNSWGSKAERGRLAYGWLEELIGDFEAAKTNRKGFNILAGQAAGDAARVLEFCDLDQRIDKLLEGLVLGDTLRGAITSFERSDRLNQPLTRRTREEVENEHPPFSIAAVRELFGESGPHLLACLDGNYDLALSESSIEIEPDTLACIKHDIVVARAVLGDVRDVDSARHLLSDHAENRRSDIAVVMAIEFYRRGQTAEAEAMQKFISRNDWTPTHLALGISQRAPWSIYPFSDY
jgi:hypothetical protein